jgi:HPr kinase/phosphorylase
MTVPVAKIFEAQETDLRLKLVAGHGGLECVVHHARVHRPGLALAGETVSLSPGRIQLFGLDEIGYLEALATNRLEEIIRRFLQTEPACVVVADGQPAPPTLCQQADRAKIPVLSSPLPSDTLADRLGEFLQECFGLTRNMHGVLVDVLGVGVLILGKSGIGKSECALDLVLRGHRLVGDDVVVLKKRPPSTVYGGCSPIIQHHMEIRGLGIISIKDLYGVSAVRDRKKVELVVEIEEWKPDGEYDRLGLDDQTYDLLGIQIPMLVIPIRQGRNTSTLVEVAVRNLLLKRQGHHSAREFQAKLVRAIAENAEEELADEEVE